MRALFGFFLPIAVLSAVLITAPHLLTACDHPTPPNGGAHADGGPVDAGCVESEAELCVRLERNCGSLDTVDKCGQPRSVASCGNCPSDLTCGARTPGVCDCTAEAPVEARHLTYSLPPVTQLGTGFNTTSSNVTGASCVEVPAVSPSDGSPERLFQMRFYRTSESFYRDMGFSVGASFGSGVFGGEGSASYFSSESINSNSAYLYLRVLVQYQPELLLSPRLKESYRTRLQENPVDFYHACGDHFIASVRRGALFEAVYRFKGVTQNMTESLATSFSAGGADWSVDASFQSTLASAASRYETELSVRESGGPLMPAALTPAELIDRARNFGTEQAGFSYATATPVAITTQSYVSADNFPPGGQLPNLRSQISRIRTLEDLQRSVRLLRNDIADRLSRPGRLLDPGCAATKQALEAKVAECDSFLRSNEDRFNACLQLGVCGANDECKSDLTIPILEMPDVPAECGPRCTAGDKSWYAVDSQGYCVRCAYEERKQSVGYGPTSQILPATCAYMRRGARVLVRAKGSVGARTARGQTTTVSGWLIVGNPSLEQAPGGGCPQSTPDCRYSVANAGEHGSIWDPLFFDLSGYVQATPGTSSPPGAAGWINQSQCAPTDQGCDFYISYDICDTDATDCGAPFPQPTMP